ncbi:MAG: beta-ketoacyl synthase [Gammaproteobacteria bacterium]|nr:MAG: beta-ketoacyl synthase [Gammaproteobacteria bacterium]
MAARKAVIAGKGLSCALGANAKASVEQLLAEEPVPASPVLAPQRVSIDWFPEPINMPWYGIATEEPRESPERFFRIFESVVKEAIDDARLNEVETSTMALFIGSSSYDIGIAEHLYQQDLRGAKCEQAFPLPVTGFGHLIGHLRRKLGFRGPDFSYSTACSASANALLGASRMIEAGICQHALVIGFELYNVTSLTGFNGLQLITSDRLRPFDKDRSGLVLGEGCGAIVLSAVDGNTDGAGTGTDGKFVIQGGASNCDTYSVTTANPDGTSIAAVINAALFDAGVNADDITAIKAHGTGSQLNDQGESAGLNRVFLSLPPISALKPYIGHTLGACGINELVLYAGALQRGLLPKTPGFKTVDPALAITPLQTTIPAPVRGHYLFNYFGFGGNNTSLIVSHG